VCSCCGYSFIPFPLNEVGKNVLATVSPMTVLEEVLQYETDVDEIEESISVA